MVISLSLRLRVLSVRGGRRYLMLVGASRNVPSGPGVFTLLLAQSGFGASLFIAVYLPKWIPATSDDEPRYAPGRMTSSGRWIQIVSDSSKGVQVPGVG